MGISRYLSLFSPKTTPRADITVRAMDAESGNIRKEEETAASPGNLTLRSLPTMLESRPETSTAHGMSPGDSTASREHPRMNGETAVHSDIPKAMNTMRRGSEESVNPPNRDIVNHAVIPQMMTIPSLQCRVFIRSRPLSIPRVGDPVVLDDESVNEILRNLGW